MKWNYAWLRKVLKKGRGKDFTFFQHKDLRSVVVMTMVSPQLREGRGQEMSPEPFWRTPLPSILPTSIFWLVSPAMLEGIQVWAGLGSQGPTVAAYSFISPHRRGQSICPCYRSLAIAAAITSCPAHWSFHISRLPSSCWSVINNGVANMQTDLQ